MKAYISNTETKTVIAVIGGQFHDDIEEKANELGYMGVDEYQLTYGDYGLNKYDNPDYYWADEKEMTSVGSLYKEPTEQ